MFVPDTLLGNAPSGKLFERLTAKSTVKAPREVGHYDIDLREDAMPTDVTSVKLLW